MRFKNVQSLFAKSKKQATTEGEEGVRYIENVVFQFLAG